MKALQLLEPQQWRQIEIAEPEPPGPGEALVRVHRVGVCGTDYSGFQGKMPFFSYPRIPGHELGVEVLAVGPDVTRVAPGDRCSVEPYINCQNCIACRTGHPNCCIHHQTLGVHCDGGLRPQFLVPARKLHVSRSLGMEQLALVETLAIGCHAVNRGAPQPGENILVIGAGPIGLSAIEFAKLSGARVFVMDINEQRLEFVRTVMGVQDTILAANDGSELKALESATNGDLAQVVIDATGSNRSMSNALNYVGFAGRLVFVGITTQEVSFAHPLMHRREMTLLASRNALASDFERIIALIEEGRINTQPWITHEAAFGEVPEVFTTWLQPSAGVIKAVIHID
ncbi:MAG: zinc-binding alcohol dehydrogenase family protein [Chthoniobacteraceae bacterium]